MKGFIKCLTLNEERPKHFLKDKGFCAEFCRQTVRGQSEDNFSWATAIEPIPDFLGKLVKDLSQQSAGVKRRRKKARESEEDGPLPGVWQRRFLSRRTR